MDATKELQLMSIKERVAFWNLQKANPDKTPSEIMEMMRPKRFESIPSDQEEINDTSRRVKNQNKIDPGKLRPELLAEKTATSRSEKNRNKTDPGKLRPELLAKALLALTLTDTSRNEKNLNKIRPGKLRPELFANFEKVKEIDLMTYIDLGAKSEASSFFSATDEKSTISTSNDTEVNEVHSSLVTANDQESISNDTSAYPSLTQNDKECQTTAPLRQDRATERRFGVVEMFEFNDDISNDGEKEAFSLPTIFDLKEKELAGDIFCQIRKELDRKNLEEKVAEKKKHRVRNFFLRVLALVCCMPYCVCKDKDNLSYYGMADNE